MSGSDSDSDGVTFLPKPTSRYHSDASLIADPSTPLKASANDTLARNNQPAGQLPASPGKDSAHDLSASFDEEKISGYSYSDVNARVKACASQNIRERYSAYVDLAPVARSKDWQNVLGNRLGRKGLAVILRDMQDEDRGLRTAAAQLISDLTYLSSENQQLVSFHPGITVGKVRVYTSPGNLAQLAVSEVGEEGDITSLIERFVFKFPATKNSRFWCYPPYKPNLAELFPDPDRHLIGYYLTTDAMEIPLFRVPTGIDSKRYAEETGDTSFLRASGGTDHAGGSPWKKQQHPNHSMSSSTAIPTIPVPLHRGGSGGGETRSSRRPQSAMVTKSSATSSVRSDDTDSEREQAHGRRGDQHRRGTPRGAAGHSDDDDRRQESVHGRRQRPQTARARFSDHGSSVSHSGSWNRTQGSGHQQGSSQNGNSVSSTSRDGGAPNGGGRTLRPSTSRPQASRPMSATPAAPPKARPRSAPVRSSLNKSRDGPPSPKGPPVRSALFRKFWEKIEEETHLTSNNINSSTTLNMVLHPAIASYKWNSATAQMRIMQYKSETTESRGFKVHAATQMAAASRPLSALTRRPAQQTTERAITTTSAADKKSFAVDVYSSPFTGATSGTTLNAVKGALDPASSTMLDFQRMLVQSENAPKQETQRTVRAGDTIVGLPVPAHDISSGELTLDKMTAKENVMKKREQQSQYATSPRGTKPKTAAKSPEHAPPAGAPGKGMHAVSAQSSGATLARPMSAKPSRSNLDISENDENTSRSQTHAVSSPTSAHVAEAIAAGGDDEDLEL